MDNYKFMYVTIIGHRVKILSLENLFDEYPNIYILNSPDIECLL